jgi:protein-disulfide isomerase
MKVSAVWMMMLTVCLMTGCGKTEQAQAAAVAPVKAEPTAGSGATNVAAVADAPSAMRYGQSLPFAILEAAERKRFVALATAELCPCDGQVSSLDDCLQKPETACSLAVESGQLMMRAIKEKASDAQITDKVQQGVANARKVHTFILEGRPSEGSETATATLVEFFDFECPHCKTMAEIVAKVAATRKSELRVVHKQFPLASHRNAPRASVASLAAHKQGRYWEFHDALFANQSELSMADDPMPLFEKFAKEAGLNMAKFKADLNDPALAKMVADDRAEGEQAGIEATPTLYLNGVKLTDARSEEDLVRIIESKLGGAKKN